MRCWHGFFIATELQADYIYSMINEQDIKQVDERLGQTIDAESVILFGSHARGDAGAHSDVDLLIVAESEQPRFKRSRKLYESLIPYSLWHGPRRIYTGRNRKGPPSAALLCFHRAKRRQDDVSPHNLFSLLKPSATTIQLEVM